MNTQELISALQGEHKLEHELLSELISVLEELKDTEVELEQEVIKKVLIFIKQTYDTGRETYILPQELEYLNDVYLPTSEEPIEDVVVLTEEEEMVAEIKELLKGDQKYNDVCKALTAAETNLNTFVEKSNATINKKKTVIFNLADKKEKAERGVKDTVILKQIRRARELAAKLKDIEENHK